MGLTSLTTTPQSCVDSKTAVQVKEASPNITMDGYEPFTSECTVSLCGTSSQPTPSAILRDTGASQSLMLADVLPFSEKTYSGISLLIQGVDCGFVSVALYDVHLWSGLVTGPVTRG